MWLLCLKYVVGTSGDEVKDYTTAVDLQLRRGLFSHLGLLGMRRTLETIGFAEDIMKGYGGLELGAGIAKTGWVEVTAVNDESLLGASVDFVESCKEASNSNLGSLSEVRPSLDSEASTF
jgi:hypothetical protein